jgi:uncharacterized ferritin-like protein (DUF455 family)
MELRTRALQALQLVTPESKCAAVQALWAARQAWTFGPAPETGSLVPGRPPLPRLIPPGEVPKRTPFTAEGRAALVHAICHIEFNAINLALDAVWRFDGMPEDFYRDWMRVAHEESQHFELLHQQLQAMGHRYGDFEAHDGLWEMCEKTAGDITARMALVPRTLEARGLDATPLIQARLRKVGTPDALRIVEGLDVILHEEIGHVEIGNRWYRWLCERQGLEPVQHYKALVERYRAPRLRPPFNTKAREAAGFSAEEIAFLAGDGLSS